MNDIKTWQERADWLSERPAPKVMVEAMKAEITELRAALAARATPAQPDAYKQRAMRIGKHVLEFATRGGWKDDGEGAFEYIQRHSYAVGYEDAGGKLGQFGTYSVNRWPIAAIVAGAQPSPSSVSATILALPLPEDKFCAWMQNGRPVNAFKHGIGDPKKWDSDGYFAADGYSREPLYTADQVRALLSEAAALAEQVQGQQWISVKDRLPEVGKLVLVYSPPAPYDYPGDVNITLDCIDPNDDDHASWLTHNENYEQFCCVAKPEGTTGPSEKARYTHWCEIPAAPSIAQDGQKSEAQ